MAKPSEEEAKQETLRHNARQIETYAHAIRPMLEPGSSPDAYVDGRGKKQKGESRMAIAQAGLDLLEDEGNYEAWTKLEPLIDRLRTRRPDYWRRIERCRDGSWWSWAISAADNEAQWEKGYLKEACRRLAEEFAKAHGEERRLQIDLNPQRKKETSHEPAASPQKAHLQHLANEKRWGAQDRWREICAEVEEIAAKMGAPKGDPALVVGGVREVIRVYRERRKRGGRDDVSPATIYRAVAFCADEGRWDTGEEPRGPGDNGEAA